MSVKLVTGAGSNAPRFRVNTPRLWRCNECKELCFLRDDRMWEPSEDGNSLTLHRHQPAAEHVTYQHSEGSVHAGIGTRKSKGSVDSSGKKRLLCPVAGCTNFLGTSAPHRAVYFCRFHFAQLPKNTKNGLAEKAQTPDFAPIFRSAKKYLEIRDAKRRHDRDNKGQ